MSYINNVTGYRKDILENRSEVHKGAWALIEPDGIVKNVIPGFENCDTTILATPKLGASFCDYIVTVHAGGGCESGFGAEGVEVFFYVFNGRMELGNGEKQATVTDGGYIFCPAGTKLTFKNVGDEDAFCFLYKRVYAPIEGHKAHTVLANINDVDWVDYEGMTDARCKDFLPSANDLGFDMNMHILSFKPGACHGYIETHYQEHGAYIYSGEGMYVLGDKWLPVKKGDYLYMDSYVPQACYAVGRGEEFAYIYSKDCNRDPEL